MQYLCLFFSCEEIITWKYVLNLYLYSLASTVIKLNQDTRNRSQKGQIKKVYTMFSTLTEKLNPSSSPFPSITWAIVENITFELPNIIVVIIILVSVLRFVRTDAKKVLVDNMSYTLQQYITLMPYLTSKELKQKIQIMDQLIVIGSCPLMGNERNPYSI